MRCFVVVVGCLDGGGSGCKTSTDGDGVVSVDKERKEVRADTIRRRGACVAVDNMSKDVFKERDVVCNVTNLRPGTAD